MNHIRSQPAPLSAARVQLKPWRTAAALLFDWSVVAAAILIAKQYTNPFVFLISLVVIGTRQHALFLIMHEGCHYLITRNRFVNDLFSNVFAGWPVGVSTARYRQRHLQHHRHLNTDQDPDWARKKDQAVWQFPMPASRYWLSSAPYLFGKGVVEMSYAIRFLGPPKKEWVQAVPFYLAVAATLTLTQGWTTFFAYWLLPYFTLVPFLHRLRYSAEHLVLPWTSDFNSTRNIATSPFERFFFCQHGTSYHLVHHLHPGVPFYHLHAAHIELSQNADYVQSAANGGSYFLPLEGSVYSSLTTMDSEVLRNDRVQKENRREEHFNGRTSNENKIDKRDDRATG